MSAETVQLPRRKRPLGVWVMTIFNSLVAGVPLLTACFKLWGLVPTGQIVFWGILGIGICASAHLTWYGSRYGRLILLALMTLHLGLRIAGNVRYSMWVIDNYLDDAYVTGQIISAVTSIVWLAANYWLLLGRRAKAFFG